MGTGYGRLWLAALAVCAAGEFSAWAGSDDSPVYWGGERGGRSYYDCSGWCWTKVSPALASIHQVNPHLRAESDGRLLEEVGSPLAAPEAIEILPYSYGPVMTVIPRRFFWHGRGPLSWHGPVRGYRFTRSRR